MRLIIWGTGSYYKRYISFFKQEDILFFVESNVELQGKELDGKMICSPEAILSEEYDFIILLVKNNQSIKEWLHKKGINGGRVKDTSSLGDVLGSEIILTSRKTSLSAWLKEDTNKKIMVCIPGFTRTGVPVAAKDLCLLLKKIGIDVVLSGYGEGALIDDLTDTSIDYLTFLEIHRQKSVWGKIIAQFDAFVLCSTLMAEFGNSIYPSATQVLWWLHESDDRWYENIDLPTGKENIHYYGGGERVLRKFSEKYPNESMEKLLYYLPDISQYIKIKNGRKKYAVIGSIDYRKGQDVLVEALIKTNRTLLQNVDIYIIGRGEKEWEESIRSQCRQFSQVHFIEELSQSELIELYKEIDLLICPSRDDPMPIVVTQAMQNGVPCLISNQVGQSVFFDRYNFGKVFESENVEELSKDLEYFLNLSDKEWKELSDNAKKVFDNNFSETSMKAKLNTILKVLI